MDALVLGGVLAAPDPVMGAVVARVTGIGSKLSYHLNRKIICIKEVTLIENRILNSYNPLYGIHFDSASGSRPNRCDGSRPFSDGKEKDG